MHWKPIAAWFGAAALAGISIWSTTLGALHLLSEYFRLASRAPF